jgi:hypothetical protein
VTVDDRQHGPDYSEARSQNNSVSGLFKKALQFTLNPFKTGLNPGRVDGLSGFSGCTLFFSFIGIITGLEEKKTGWSRFNEDFLTVLSELSKFRIYRAHTYAMACVQTRGRSHSGNAFG